MSTPPSDAGQAFRLLDLPGELFWSWNTHLSGRVKLSRYAASKPEIRLYAPILHYA